MRNRAKCALCKEVLESLHLTDLVVCKCGAISIEGGKDSFVACAREWSNFLRVDDEGNEIVVTIVNKDEVLHEPPAMDEAPAPLTREEKIEMLSIMLKNMENLPPDAMYTYLTQYDLYNTLAIIVSIFKSQ